jgi:hypothetical protein
VGDSFTDNFDRFFAESYRHVIVVDLRHYSDTLESLLSENEVDDCVFIMAADTMLSDYVIDSLR